MSESHIEWYEMFYDLSTLFFLYLSLQCQFTNFQLLTSEKDANLLIETWGILQTVQTTYQWWPHAVTLIFYRFDRWSCLWLTWTWMNNWSFWLFEGCWIKRFGKQDSNEISAEMDEREAEATSYMQPCRGSQAVSLYHLVLKGRHSSNGKKPSF